MNEQEFAELSAGHALGALSPADEQAYSAALDSHPEWERIARADEQTAGMLGDAVEDVAPSPGVRADILARIAQMPPSHPSPAASAAPSSDEKAAEGELPVAGTGRAGTRHAGTRQAAAHRRAGWGPRAWFALAASVALLVGVGAGAVWVSSVVQTPEAVTALDRIEAAPDAQRASTTLEDGAVATLHWSQQLGDAVLVSDGLPQLTDDQAYELWYVRDEGPVAAGVFSAGEGDTVAELEGAMQPGDIIAVTVEQAGGSPSGAPTTDPILAIPTEA